MGREGRRTKILLAAVAVWLGAAVAAQEGGGDWHRLRFPFDDPRAVDRPARDRAYDLIHVRAELELDPEARRFAGAATLRLRVLAPEAPSLILDAKELEIRSVTDADDREVPFEEEAGGALILRPEPAPKRGDVLEVTVRYRGAPRRGLYFIGPDAGYPHKPRQVWTQGEPEETRYWLPVYDDPNDKATSEMIVTVPGDWSVLSNGRLVEVRTRDGRRAFHWVEAVPHSTYLLTVVAGRFDIHEARAGDVALAYYVPPGTDRATVQRSFARTPEMVRFFEAWTGVDYPFEKYAQVTVEDFLWGGMENTSATTLYRDTLHDEAAEPNFTSEGLVAHELAHQWFGDLVTCRDWSHIWLNESFATFMTNLWYEHSYGPEEYDYRRYRNLREYLREDREEHRRPIVWDRYVHPMDLFDRHSYPKGGLVLAMLRAELGDAVFREGLRAYLRAHARGNAVTEDLRRALAAASGRELDSFFRQWLYRAGHPEFQVRSRWDAVAREVVLEVAQTQPAREWTPVFRGGVDVELKIGDEARRRRLEIRARRERFHLPAPSPPQWIRFDPDQVWIKTLDFDKSDRELRDLAASDPNVIGRIWALEQLVARLDVEADREAVAARLAEEPFYGVRAEAARALGESGRVEAAELIGMLLGDADPRVREEAAKALGELAEKLPEDRLPASGILALREVVEREAKSYVVAAALESLGRAGAEDARPLLMAALGRPSHRDIIAQGALKGLGALGGEEDVEILMQWAAYGRPPRAREAAIAALGKAGSGREAVRRFLESLLHDPYVWARREAAKALGELGDARAVGALEALARRELERRVQREAERAVRKLQAGRPR